MCHQSVKCLTEMSKLKMFHGERNWLVFSDSLENSVSVLTYQNINSDAEIMLALQNKPNEYQLYDVYNPSFDKHGKLNVTKRGRWSYKSLEMNTSTSKFEERRNFGGIRFHAVITIPKRATNTTLLEHIDSVDNVQTDSIDHLLVLIIALGLHHAFNVEIRNKQQVELVANGNVDSSYSNCIIVAFGYLFQQGYSWKSLLLSSRFFITTMLIFSIILYQYYGSFILLTESPKTITTVKRLLESNIYFYTYMDEVPYILDNFKRVKEKSAVQLVNKVMKNNPIFLLVSKGVTMIKLGHAFHTDASYAYLLLKFALTDHEICDLQEIQYQEKLQCGPGVPVRSHLREWIKISLRRIHDTGLMAYHWKIWMGHKPKCETDDLEVIPVDIVHFSSAIYALVIGMQISFAFFIAEVLMRRTHTSIFVY